MKPSFPRWSLAAVALACWSGIAASAASSSGPVKPRLIVTTDISNEPDDEESLVRLLVYSNEIDLEGVIATTSVWLRDTVRPELITRDIEAYRKVRENLMQHAPGFPSAGQLLAGVKASCPVFGMAGVGDGRETDGSRWIIQAVDRPDERPLWIAIWGGPNCLAQALWDVKRTRPAAAVDAFVAKLRVYAISDQDDSGTWIRRTFPRLQYIVSPTTVNADEYATTTWSGISGDRHYRNGPGDHFDLVDNPWLTEHIRESHGPLGALYPEFKYIMEGDTPSFLSLVANGLAASESPGWGGWGGRYVWRQPVRESRPIWTSSDDTVTAGDGRTYTSNQATVWRWRQAFQDDFAARMDWCVKSRAQANHNPLLVVNGAGGRAPVHIAAEPGDVIRLSADGSTDPDGDTLSFRWFYYSEAGGPSPNPDHLALSGAETASAVVTVPPGAWQALHVILEVRDGGRPPLFSYRRIIIERKGRTHASGPNG
jgi:hypothetical protein